MREQLKKHRALLIAIMIIITFLQKLIQEFIPVFSYLDELISTVFLILALILAYRKKWEVDKNDRIAIILMVITIVIGIMGNIFSHISVGIFSILLDIHSLFKVLFGYYFFKYLYFKQEELNKIFNIIDKFCRVYISIMFIFYILSFVFDTGMLYQARYGIPSYKFLYDNPANMSKIFYFILIFMAISLKEKTLKSKIYTGLSLVLMASTLRSRAIAFVIIYIAGYIYMVTFEKRANIKLIIGLAAASIMVAYKQILFYFTNTGQARNRLLVYGIETMVEYFPTGAGFGTYGSNVAAVNYSPLYLQYGFDKVYGIGLHHTRYLNDNFWPMLFGQYGLFGTITYMGIWVIITKEVLHKCSQNKYNYYGCFSISLFLLISSLADKSYVEFTTIPVLIMFALLAKVESVE